MTSMNSPEDPPIKICTKFKPGPDLHVSHWLPRLNHIENKERKKRLCGHKHQPINITSDLSTCITTKDIAAATQDNIPLQDLKTYITEASCQTEVMQNKRYYHIGHLKMSWQLLVELL